MKQRPLRCQVAAELELDTTHAAVMEADGKKRWSF